MIHGYYNVPYDVWECGEHISFLQLILTVLLNAFSEKSRYLEMYYFAIRLREARVNCVMDPHCYFDTILKFRDAELLAEVLHTCSE